MWSQSLQRVKPESITKSYVRRENILESFFFSGSTCHHTDSTIRENIQPSTFSNAIMNVCGSRQSSGTFFEPFLCFLVELTSRIDDSPTVWKTIALNITEFDNQKVNLHNGYTKSCKFFNVNLNISFQ